ncbi:MAG: peptide ABC transporter substrate-binding protein [Solobacterium sp.]|nr:peptide ABC transporter substrate-binding protein [Solobacterium sp.]
MNFRKLFAASLATAMLVGCGTSTDAGTPAAGTDTGTDTASGAASEVVVAFDADLNTMDHHIATDGNSFIMQSMCYSGLTSLDKAGTPVAELATSWDVSEDGLVYTFHIAEDATWSNGTPVTANDFVYGWRRLDDPAIASEYAFILDTIHVVNAAEVNAGEKPLEDLGVKAVDDKTFEVTLTLPCDFLLGLMAFPSFFPLNQEFFESQGDQFALGIDNMIYCGPYNMTGWEQGNSYTFTKREDYFNQDPEAVETVVFRFQQDTQSALLEYQSGNIDVVKLQGEQVDMYKDEPGFTNRLQGYLWYIPVNLTVDKLQNLNLRKALHYAINRESIANDVLKDGSIAAEGEIPVELATGPDGKDFRETAGVLTEYNPEKAAECYAAAVEELGGDVTLELMFEDSEASKAVAENLQQQFQTNCPGLTVTLNSKPKKERLALMKDQQYELGLTRWGPDYADPQTYMDLFLSTNVSNNQGRYNSPAYDELVLKATQGEDATDSAKRWADLIEAERIMVAEDFAVIPIYQNGGAMMINTAVENVNFHSAGVDDYRHIYKK